MTIWRPNIGHRPGPRYLAVADAIAESIANGSLRARDRLPPQRELATALGLSLNTITRAYAEAMRRGLLEGEVGRGTFVRAAGSLVTDASAASLTRVASGPIDFSLNLPFVGGAAAALAMTLGELGRSPVLASLLDHQQPADRGRHADAGAAWIERLGLGRSGRSVVLCNGAQHGIFASLLALTRPGDALLVEELSYAPIKSMARHLGLRLVPVALDDGGLSPDALEDVCRSTAAKVLYCLPTLQTPTAITMTEERRIEIARIAEGVGLTIIEDDVFGFLPMVRPKPLAAFGPSNTIFVTGVSKSMAPGLRVGYLHAPEHLKSALEAAVALSTWMPAPLNAEIAACWIEDGTAARLNDEQRTEASARQRIAHTLLGDCHFSADPTGFHLWLRLPDRWRSESFWLAAKQRGVELQHAAAFALDPGATTNAVRLCLSHELSRERVIAGLQIVRDLLDHDADDSAFVV